MKGNRVGAVVVGGDYQGLGIVRSLGRHGIPVCIIDDERSIARFSRYATHSVRVPDLRDEARTIEALLDFGRKNDLKGWVLFPTRDDTVAALSRHKDQLKEIYRVPTADWDTIRWAWDKRNTYKLAIDLGIPVPRMWQPRTLADLDQIEGPFPVALKPAIKEHFVYATKAKAWRADNPQQLKEIFQRAAEIMDPAEIIIQDIIPGDGHQQYAYGSFFKNHEPIGSMLARRRRQHPPEFGRASTYVETIEQPLLEEMSVRYLRSINYYGLVELEYKLDPRDNQFKLLDFNARTWGYHTLGQSAGVDFPYLLFADQMGQPVEPARAQPGVTWIRIVTDLPTGLAEIASKRMNWSSYLRSVRKSNTEAVLSVEDPFPGVAELFLLPYLYVRRGF